MARSKREISRPTSTVLVFLFTWLGCLLAFAGALTLGVTTLTLDGKGSVPGFLVLTALVLSSFHYLFVKFRREEYRNGPAAALEGPLIMVVASWTIFRFTALSSPLLVILPAIVLASITFTFPPWLVATCWLTAAVVEAGQVLSGGQEAIAAVTNILLCLIVAAAWYFLRRSIPFMRQRHQASIDRKSRAEAKEQVKELGLERENSTAILQDLDSFDSAELFSRQTIDSINSSFEIQLEMIRHALDLTTVAILWPSPDKEELRLRYLSSSREDINPGPYPMGAGITGALGGSLDEAELVEVRPSHPAIPYYHKKEGVGAVLAIRIPSDNNDRTDSAVKRRTGILCADRLSDSPWTDREKKVLRFAAEKIGLEIRGSRLLLNLDRDRSAINRLCLGFRELNSVLDLETIFDAAMKALMAQAPAEAMALCLRENEQYQVTRVAGEKFLDMAGQYFPVTDGMVGQALKTGRTLPVGGRYLGPAPIFTDRKQITGLQSLLLVPLPDESTSPSGCLVLASPEAGVFNRSRQEILELIAAQIAIKIKLGQAHEQLGRLATTDGLTGLDNHRAFQHGYGVMLDRAKRTGTPLCLLMGDLDHFKKINDNFGHPFGDHVLQKVAGVMADTVRTVDLASRYGGEEFALLLENCDADGGHILADRIRSKIENLDLVCRDKPLKVTISIGIAVFPETATEKDLLIERADKALYEAKKTGRNQTVLWSGEIN